MDKNKKQDKKRLRRRHHVRNKLRGSADHPRMCVARTLHHFGCQLIDDVNGKTLVSASTKDKDQRDRTKPAGNSAAAAAIGKSIAEKAAAAGIRRVKLDRGHAKYHGRVKAFAEAAREAGLEF